MVLANYCYIDKRMQLDVQARRCASWICTSSLFLYNERVKNTRKHFHLSISNRINSSRPTHIVNGSDTLVCILCIPSCDGNNDTNGYFTWIIMRKVINIDRYSKRELTTVTDAIGEISFWKKGINCIEVKWNVEIRIGVYIQLKSILTQKRNQWWWNFIINKRINDIGK